jgi:hypothetical protein
MLTGIIQFVLDSDRIGAAFNAATRGGSHIINPESSIPNAFVYIRAFSEILKIITSFLWCELCGTEARNYLFANFPFKLNASSIWGIN